MDESLIDDDRLSPERRSLLPGTGFFYPDSLDEGHADERAAAALAGATAAVVADSDADGLGCVALLREAFGRPAGGVALDRIGDDDDGDEGDEETADTPGFVADRDPADPVAAVVEAVEGEDTTESDDGPDLRGRSEVGLVPSGPNEVAAGLARAAAYLEPGADAFVCDVSPESIAAIEVELRALLERAGTVRWFDHHQWDPETARAVREMGVDLVVGEDDAECTADVTLRSVDYDFPDHLVELAAVTRDHDLWIKEDPRSDDLADLSYWLDAETYVELVRAHGPDLPQGATDFLAERRRDKNDRIDRAVNRADTYEFAIDGRPAAARETSPPPEAEEGDPSITVAVTYGRCSQNEVAERLRGEGADAVVVTKPGGGASIRGSETFQRAHEVARQVGGGGHPKAAGCRPDVFEDMLDYAHHWTTRGAVAKRRILAAFESLE